METLHQDLQVVSPEVLLRKNHSGMETFYFCRRCAALNVRCVRTIVVWKPLTHEVAIHYDFF